MNFSKINYRSFWGRLFRLPLRLIPKRMAMPIMQGRLRGTKWIVGAGEHGYWLGSYEMNKRLAFEREIKPGTVMYDIGANVGYFSLLAAELAGPEGQVYAFEPLPRNVEFLEKHIKINKCNNIEIVEAAVSDHSGEAHFDLGASTAMGHIAESGGIQVKMVALDEMLAAGELRPPDYMKVDVEGAEYEALKGARNLLEKYHPLLFLDTHQREAHLPTIELLKELGYKFEILDGKSLTATKELIARYPN
ncbi:MAG: FkbM family methyltransferase [Anaerolineaceae bacterium]|nr:FkbM family methyltransferase [Anaerolineaceae bacterium]